ncbi:amidohydrolase family protein [Biformimicrobium ophioploci]|uniref:Amidohydrolase-related domain-containing protein n=1 Tax=Biformimicrobium ophioploci TaxID=3036711 RepID=A0ABQ6LZU7_9GAMM|nr:amidohydrolase family protein [Microbulbifer sp. NKW57]GMG87589.1 hypothetical protein MNKW57_19100 [Microbulbifer sp. NKW57]
MKALASSVGLVAFLTLSTASLHADTKEYIYHDPEGAAGSEVVHVDGDTIKTRVEIKFNNRRVRIAESYRLDENGYPNYITREGVSPFGAKIDDTYKVIESKATWSGIDENGSKTLSSPHFFIPKNMGVFLTTTLVKALLEDANQSVNLLPQGTAKLIKLDQATLNKGGEETSLILYGISGMGFLPETSWHTENGDFFATSFRGGSWVIAESGWTKDELGPLIQKQLTAETSFLKGIANANTHKSSAPVLIENANIVDVENGKLLTEQNLLIQKGKIVKISGEPIKEKNATRINAAGKSVVPGLWDMHAHMSPMDGTLNMAAGVVNVRDIGNSHDNIMHIEKLFQSDDVIGGKLYPSGFMDGESENSARNGMTAASLEDALKHIDFFADNGYVQVKSYSSIKPEWVKPMAERIHSRGMRYSGHIPAFMTAEEAVDAGFDEIQHINMLFLNFMDRIDTRERLRFTEVGEHAHELDLESEEVEAFLDKLARKGTVVDATIAVFNELLMSREGEVSPELASIADHLPANVRRQNVGSWLDIKPEHRHAYAKSAEALLEMIKKAHDHGVTLVAGTDGMPGFILHRELELYAKAGIPNADVLRTATVNAAKTMNAWDRTGSVEVGKDADLVLVEGNPLEDISALRNTVLVIEGQNLYQPDALYSAMGIQPFIKSVDFEIAQAQ